MAMPHGRSVGGPYSSWLKKFPRRPMACITNRPGAMTSAHFQNDCFQSQVTTIRAIVPVMIPPYTPRPLYGGRMILTGSSLYRLHWSMTWYSRPPISAATATMMIPLSTSFAFMPRRRASRVITR